MSSMQRRKGHAYERWVACKLRKHFPHAKRGLSQTRSGEEVSDIDGTPFWIECKHHKQVNARRALTQAQRDAKAAGSIKIPIAATRDNGKDDIVTMSLDDFIRIAGCACVADTKSVGSSKTCDGFQCFTCNSAIPRESAPSSYQGKR